MRRLTLPALGLLSSVASAQVPARLTGSFVTGPLSITFDSDEYRISRGDQVAIIGRFRLVADTITFRDLSGPIACIGPVIGRYLWQLTAEGLSFTLIGDECSGRRGAMPGRVWLHRNSDVLALTGATVIDGTGGGARPGMTILIADSSIADVFPDGTKPIPAGAQRRNLSGRYVIPGLIDTHVHVASDLSGEDRRPRAESRLRRALLGGVTSVRDMAGDARALADLSRAALVGEIVSPAIYYSALFAGPEFFTDYRVRAASRGVPLGTAPWARAVTAGTDWRQVIAEARGTGATGIKLYAAISGDLLGPLVAQAHAQGMRVWSHTALFPARPGEAVGAGVDVLSHAPEIAREADTISLGYRGRGRYQVNYQSIPPSHPTIDRLIGGMVAKKTIVEPTLFVIFARDSVSPRARWAAAITRELHRRGVPISAGTDGLIGVEGADSLRSGALPNLHRELELLVHQAGLSPEEAIIAATRTAAQVIGIERRTGTLTPGMAADLVVLTADPVADISNTRRIDFVLKGGKQVASPGGPPAN